MTVHPGPTPWQAIVITYPTPNDQTHTWQQRWEDIRGDLLQEHLELTRTHHTLHPIQGVGQAPQGIHSPGVWAYATPMNPQAAEDIKTALSIQQAQNPNPAPQHPTRLHHLVGIPRPRHPHPPTRGPPSRQQHNRPPPSRSSGSHTGRGPGNLGPTIPGRNQSRAPRERGKGRGHKPPQPRSAPTEATVNLLDLNYPAVTYSKDATTALQELPMAQGPGWVPHLLTFQEQGLQRDDPPETTPTYTPDQKAYKWYWHKGTPLYAQTGIHVHLVHHLSVPGRLGVYEVVGDGWQLNIINAHVPFGYATEPFLQALAEAYRQMAMLAPTVIIGDMNAAPTPADQGGQATPQDQAVHDTIEMLGLVDLTANLEGQPSHFPHQTDAAPSRIHVCYGDPATIIRAEARYGPLPLGPTGHSPLHIRLTIPNLPPSPPEDADKGLPPPLKMPPLHDKHAWSQYCRAIDRARRIQPDPTDLLTAMRTAAVACGFQQHPHTDDD